MHCLADLMSWRGGESGQSSKSGDIVFDRGETIGEMITAEQV
jgi:hypothetical protein